MFVSRSAFETTQIYEQGLESVMGQLGDALELINQEGPRFTTFRAVVHNQTDLQVSRLASSRSKMAIGRRKATLNTCSMRDVITVLHVWADLPFRARVESFSEMSQQDPIGVRILNGEAWVFRDRNGCWQSGVGKLKPPFALTDIERHFDLRLVRQMFSELNMKSLGQVRAADRDCIRLQGVLRDEGLLWPHWLPDGADRYEFDLDIKQGVLLGIFSWHGSDLISSYEVLDVTFDEVIDSSLFSCEISPLEPIHPTARVPEPLTLAEAVVRVPFTVLVPGESKAAEGISLKEIIYRPSNGSSGWDHLTFFFRGSNLLIDQAACPNPDLCDLEWERIEFGARVLMVSDPGPGDGKIVVTCEYYGTHVVVISDLDRNRLMQLATTLVPVERSG